MDLWNKICKSFKKKIKISKKKVVDVDKKKPQGNTQSSTERKLQNNAIEM